MKLKNIFALNVMAATLAACGGGGDINLNPSTSVGDTTTNITNPPATTPTVNPCAQYSASGQAFQGIYASGNCTYPVTFVADTRPLTVDLLIPELPNGGLHIFEDSLFVGEDVNASAAAAGKRVPQDGEGPTLTIAAGAKLAFSASEDYMMIARGSRIVAEGTASKPIIISSVTDLRDNNATEADRGLWGGLLINGNGLTNKCVDAQRLPNGSNPHNCHITAEGRPSTYGGNNNDESSGVLRYVVIKHAGYEVVDGSELNGITFNAVGSGTKVEYVQTYTTQDDGFEMFGGAVDLKYVVGVNVGDDTYDFSEGWVGNIQFALSVATSGGNTCVEADNTGSGRADDLTPLTKGRISNLTCVTSNVDSGQGDHPSSKGDSEGVLYREGTFFEMYNSIVTSSADGMASNECFEVIDSEGDFTIDAIEAGWSVATSNIVACTEATKLGLYKPTGAPADYVSPNAGFNLKTWLASNNNAVIDTTVAGALPATVLQGLSTNKRAYITAPAMSDGTTAPISIPVFDVTRLDDDFDANEVPQLGSSGSSSFFTAVNFIGAVSADNDWTEGWTVGLND